ncbi:MAG: ketopantoate reductase family protein [Sphaerochaeta sp.]|jgi:2-dehydropantoate 2-reductase|nr:ketopantoate reductase family protein [Sphaerochaeta sp.]PKL28341.1 MAG: ketopantoate reductase family protein [Spirochaetae bacterium HGW-Spirochaetae-2]
MIRTVSVIGIGAVGAIYAWRLSEFLGYDQVRVIVNQERQKRYMAKGMVLNGSRVDFNFVTPQNQVEPADLILLATKNHHLEQAIEDMRAHVGPETMILSLLNGIDSEEELEARFGPEHVLYGFTTVLDSTRVGTRIDFSTEGIIYFGEKRNTRTPRIEALAELFTGAKINHVVPENIECELWAKFMVNVSINTISAITRGTYGDCANIPAIRHLIVDTQREVVALAEKVGIEGLGEAYIEKYQKVFASLEYGGKTSMLQDIEAGRPTENNWFCVRASKLGKELGVPTPLIDVLGRIADGAEAVQKRRHDNP